jgi:FKBP-type peptidyl-prolyl cis-trans isomerase SlyD
MKGFSNMSVQVISFNCLLSNKAGQLISTTFNRDVLNVQSETSMVLAGLTKGLQNLKKGEKRKIELTAAEAYGLYDPNKIKLFPKSEIPKNLKIGDAVTLVHRDGSHNLYKIVQFFGPMVSLDGNHPLSGQDLVFEIEAINVREATREEIDQSENNFKVKLLH